jgi:hypothetical protein
MPTNLPTILPIVFLISFSLAYLPQKHATYQRGVVTGRRFQQISTRAVHPEAWHVVGRPCTRMA